MPSTSYDTTVWQTKDGQYLTLRDKNWSAGKIGEITDDITKAHQGFYGGGTNIPRSDLTAVPVRVTLTVETLQSVEETHHDKQ